MSRSGSSRAPVALGTLVGLGIGATIGYLVGPVVPVLGHHLDLVHVATAGRSLGAVEAVVLTGLAERAAAWFYGGAVLFGAVGFMVGRSVSGTASGR